MRILLINPPDELSDIFGVGKMFVQKYEPLGLLYLAAVAQRQGHHVDVVDCYAEEMSSDELMERIAAAAPDVAGISTLTSNGAVVYRLGKWIRERFPDTLVVLGNVHASVFADAYLRNGCCDAVVHGEGEVPFSGILEAREKGLPLDSVPGLSLVGPDGTPKNTGPGGVVSDLSELPFPARELVHSSLYNLSPISNQLYVGRRGAVVKTLSTSRGCPNRCSFCVPRNNQSLRFNDPVKVVDEMELLEKRYRASYLYIIDPLFIADRDRVLAICAEIRRRRLAVRWGSSVHVNYVDRELIGAMESAGCHDVNIGIETANQRTLDLVRKGTRVERVEDAVRMIKATSRLLVEGLFMLGLPGESPEDAMRTIRFARSLPLDMAQFSILTPYPGSPLFEELAAKGEIDTGVRPDGSVDLSVWKRYAAYVLFTGLQPVWVSPSVTSDELIALQKRAQREFYLRPSQILRHARRLTPKTFVPAVRILLKGLF